MANELIGTVKVVLDEQTFASGFNKREIVVTDSSGKYPQEIKIEFVKDKTKDLASLAEGDQVKVLFDIRGNEYNGKYYVNLVGWKIETLSAATATPKAEADPVDEDIPLDDEDAPPPF